MSDAIRRAIEEAASKPTPVAAVRRKFDQAAACSHPRKRQRRKLEFCCARQGQIRANGWIEMSKSYRALFTWLWKRWHWPCSSPRRNQCRRGTSRPGRDYDPARWPCTGPGGRDLFLGPLMWSPIDEAIWYERGRA